MSFDGGWGYILSTVIGVVLVWLGQMVGKHFGKGEEVADDAHIKIDDLYELVTNLRTDFLIYQRHVSETYAKTTQLERMETGILTAIQRLEEKIDRMQERGALT